MKAVIERSKLTTRRFQNSLLETIFASPLYQATLRTRTPKSLKFTPEPRWPGDKQLGEGILIGQFDLGEEHQITTIDPWATETSNEHTRVALHSFGWLHDLAASGDQEVARSRVQTLVADWISVNHKWSAIPWRADIIGERIAIWLQYYDRYFAKGRKSFRLSVMQNIARQLVHLGRIVEAEPIGSLKFSALKGLIFGAVCFPSSEKRLTGYLRKLDVEIEAQILEDGGHIERSPTVHHQLLRSLVEIKLLLVESQNAVPETLQSAIDRMSPALRFYRHQDGGLCHFNGSREENAEHIDLTLIKADARGQPPRRLPYTGFERLLSGRILLLADTGSPPPPAFNRLSHAGTLSIEVSVGRERLITNCGAARTDDIAWHSVQRTTAAHSTLSIGDRNSSELLEDGGGIGNRCAEVSCQKIDDPDYLGFSAQHNGYRSTFGATHIREIRISKDSEIIEGVDRILDGNSEAYIIRFHIHPDVSVSVAQGGKSALMKLAKGGGWRFSVEDQLLQVEESIYLGDTRPRRSRQIVIEGETRQGVTEVSWSISPVT